MVGLVLLALLVEQGNGIGRITWKITLEPGKKMDLTYDVDHIEPAVELEANLAQMPHLLEAELGVQTDAGGLAGIDPCDDRTTPQNAGALDQVPQHEW